MTSRLFSVLLTLAALVSGIGTAQAAWPEKPIRVVVPSAPGSGADAMTRALTEQLSRQMGVPFVVDNKPGGSTVIGVMDIVHAPADGYTIGYGNFITLATNRSLLAKVPYDVDKDLTLLAGTWRTANFLVVNNSVPVKSVSELMAYAKQNPGKLAFASDGNGTSAHLGMEMFKYLTGTDILHVPYKASSASLTDLLGGNVQMMLANISIVAPHVQAGRMRVLGVSSQSRATDWPQVPAIAETVPGFEVVAWGGMIAPAKLPPEIAKRLETEIRKALANPAVQERYRTMGVELTPTGPDEFRELVRTESVKWAQVIKASGAKID